MDEKKLYDRQIRLWGLESQKRISKTRLLVVGMGGLSAEVCKNLVLTGIGSITIMDNTLVQWQHLGCQFFVDSSCIGQNIATASLNNLQMLNPLVKVTSISCSMAQKLVEEKEEENGQIQGTFLDGFDIVLLTGCLLSEQIQVNEICRRKGILLFVGDTFGQFGMFFSDLLDFEFTWRQQVPNLNNNNNSNNKLPSTTRTNSGDDLNDIKMIKEKRIFFDLKQIHGKKFQGWMDGTKRNKGRGISKQWFGLQMLYYFKDRYKRFPSLQMSSSALVDIGIETDYSSNANTKKKILNSTNGSNKKRKRTVVDDDGESFICDASDNNRVDEGDLKDFYEFCQENLKMLPESPEIALLTTEMSLDYCRILCRNAGVGGELNHICAITGGILAQEILKAINKDCEPVYNYFVYDGAESNCGFVEFVQ